jgi:hypothetical protein
LNNEMGRNPDQPDQLGDPLKMWNCLTKLQFTTNCNIYLKKPGYEKLIYVTIPYSGSDMQLYWSLTLPIL